MKELCDFLCQAFRFRQCNAHGVEILYDGQIQTSLKGQTTKAPIEGYVMHVKDASGKP